jgi:hypothetical protein
MYPGSKCKVSLDIQDLQVKLFLYLQDLVFILTGEGEVDDGRSEGQRRGRRRGGEGAK